MADLEANEMQSDALYRMGFVVVVGLALATVSCADVDAQQDVAVDADDIGGVVAGPNGPEAGVWGVGDEARTHGTRTDGPART